MSILETINSSNDIKKIEKTDLPALCEELRSLIIDTVAENGGHLASNLGAVELTVALHRVYDTSKDRLVFDVGHQCYSHKIITGRRDVFGSLRQFGGLSGFPKPYESVDDAFVAGHASTSVAVALGMARSRTLLNEDYDVVCVLGDGALTGGTALEGIAEAAASNEPIVIILNDNNMSISENVGGVARMLRDMRIKPAYINFKRIYRNVFKRMPRVYDFNHGIKERLKRNVLPTNIFSSFGLEYLGPIDGHDINKLERAIRYARDLKQPVLLHVLTVKGKGYKYAVEHPDKFHGVGRFNKMTGEISPEPYSFSEVLGEELCSIAEGNERIAAITAAMPGGTGLESFEDTYPERFFDTGIAEESAVAMAAGMAKQGLVPVIAIYSTFLQRAYDMLIHDVGLSSLHVVLAVDRAGIVGTDGETHQGLFDVSYLRSVPNMTVFCPANFDELKAMLNEAVFNVQGPVAIRYPRGGESQLYREVHLEPSTLLTSGQDYTVVTYGVQTDRCLQASELLKQKGIEIDLIKLNRIDMDDYSIAAESVKKTGRLLVIEEACSAGSIGEALTSYLFNEGISVSKLKLVNCGNGIVENGSCESLYRKYGFDAKSVASLIEAGLQE